MSAAAAAAVSRATNARVELARYTIAAGERVIYGQRVLGVVRLVDLPAGGHGRPACGPTGRHGRSGAGRRGMSGVPGQFQPSNVARYALWMISSH